MIISYLQKSFSFSKLLFLSGKAFYFYLLFKFLVPKNLKNIFNKFTEFEEIIKFIEYDFQ